MEQEVSDFDSKTTGSTDDASQLPEVEVRRSKCRKFPVTVEPMVFGLFFADTLSDLVSSNFILWRTCEDHFHYNKSICDQLAASSGNKSNIEATVQPYSTTILTAMNFLSIFLPAITSLFVGPWSDHNGRKLVLLIPAVGYTLKYMLLAIFSINTSLGPEFAIVSVVPVALCGGIVNFISAAYSYVSDVTPEDKRFFRISMIEFVLGLGVYSGLMLLSNAFQASAAYQYAIVYAICAFTVIIVAVPTYIFLPESVQNAESGKGILSFFELKLFKEMIDVCFKKREGNKRLVIFLSIACLTITLSAGSGNSNVLYFFTRLRFGWNIQDFTFWASISLATYFLGLFVGVMLLSKWLKISETILGLLSFGTSIAMSFYIAFIPPQASYLMYYSGLVNILGGLACPICRSILSKSVPKDDVGKVYALTTSTESFFPLIFGPLYTVLYNATIHTLPSAFLILSGCLYIFCMIFFVIIYIKRKHPEPEYGSVGSQTDSG